MIIILYQTEAFEKIKLMGKNIRKRRIRFFDVEKLFQRSNIDLLYRTVLISRKIGLSSTLRANRMDKDSFAKIHYELLASNSRGSHGPKKLRELTIHSQTFTPRRPRKFCYTFPSFSHLSAKRGHEWTVRKVSCQRRYAKVGKWEDSLDKTLGKASVKERALYPLGSRKRPDYQHRNEEW